MEGCGIEGKVLQERPEVYAALGFRHEKRVGVGEVILPLHTVEHWGLLRHDPEILLWAGSHGRISECESDHSGISVRMFHRDDVEQGTSTTVARHTQ